MPLLTAGVLLWGPRRRRTRAAALCAALLPHRRRRSAQLVHRTVPRVAITVHKHNEHDSEEHEDDPDDEATGEREKWRNSARASGRPPENGADVDTTGSSGARGPVLTSGDVSVLLGETLGQAVDGEYAQNATGKAWIASPEEREAWKVSEGTPWILDGDGPWIGNKPGLWNIDGQGPWSWHAEGPWSDGEADVADRVPDCLRSAECRSVWALTLDHPVCAARDEDSADSGAHLSTGPDSPSSSGADQLCKNERHTTPEERPTGGTDPACQAANHGESTDAPAAAALAVRQLWGSSGEDGAALQVSPATCDLLARIATVWQADLEERHRLDRRAAGDSGHSESEPSSPEPASPDGERGGEVRSRG